MTRDRMNGTAVQARDYRGRWDAIRANVEDVPRLPSSAARLVLEDPRAVQYVAAWTSHHYGEGVAVDLVARLHRHAPDVVLVETSRLSFAVHVVRHRRFAGRYELAWRCPDCGRGARYLYLHRVSTWGIRHAIPGCARCRRLRWSSQGRPIGSFARAMRGGAARAPVPRHPWDPLAVGTPEALRKTHPGLLALVDVGVTERAVRRPTMRDMESIRSHLATMPAKLARLRGQLARFEGGDGGNRDNH